MTAVDAIGPVRASGRERHSWARPVSAAVAAVALGGMALLAFRECAPSTWMRAGGEEARRTLQSLADALKPAAVTSPLVVLRGEDRTPKLVVYTHAADVAVDLVQDTWYGDTFSRVEAKGCRAQFVVAVDGMSDDDVVLVPGAEGEPARILVLAPRPRVDEEMLAVAPESVVFTERNTGLRKARGLVGADNRDEVVRALRPALLEAVSDGRVRARAEEAGREFFERRFAEWLRGDLRLGRDVVVEVRWVE
jgi:hypothetical protein